VENVRAVLPWTDSCLHGQDQTVRAALALRSGFGGSGAPDSDRTRRSAGRLAGCALAGGAAIAAESSVAVAAAVTPREPQSESVACTN